MALGDLYSEKELGSTRKGRTVLPSFVSGPTLVSVCSPSFLSPSPAFLNMVPCAAWTCLQRAPSPPWVTSYEQTPTTGCMPCPEGGGRGWDLGEAGPRPPPRQMRPHGGPFGLSPSECTSARQSHLRGSESEARCHFPTGEARPRVAGVPSMWGESL